MVNLAILLKEQGYEVDFLVYGQNDFYQHILDEHGIAVRRIQAKGPVSRIRRVTGYLKKQKAYAVIAFLETPGFLACVAKACGGRWRLITNELSAKESTFKGKRQRIFNRFERYSDVKVCNSHHAMEMWKKYYPQYTSKLRVIYNPVLMPMDRIGERSVARDGKLRIVVAASYQKLKNPLGVIDALCLLDADERNQIRIDWYGRFEVVTGDTSIYDEATRRIQAGNLQDTIVLHGETKDIYPIMHAADVVGLFSTVEGLPNAICEGMMLGKPIVMSRVSDYEILTEGNGILCDPNPQSIAHALRRLCELTEDQMADMGMTSQKKAEKLFGKESIVRQWIEVLSYE